MPARDLLARLQEVERAGAAWLGLDEELYPASALAAAATAFAGLCSIEKRTTGDVREIRLEVPVEYREERSRVVREFLNFALCEAVHATARGRQE